MKNGKMFLAVIGTIMLLVGFVVGSQQAQIRAADRFVPKDQYNRDIAELKRDVKQLLRFHLEERAGTP